MNPEAPTWKAGLGLRLLLPSSWLGVLGEMPKAGAEKPGRRDTGDQR